MNKIISKILELNRDKPVLQLNHNEEDNSGKIDYSDEIRKYRDISKFRGHEELIRAYLVSHLVHQLDYEPRFIELEKEYQAGRPKTIKPRIDLILKDKSGNNYFFVEVKSPDKWEADQKFIEGQLFKLAKLEDKPIKYLVYYTADIKRDGSVVDKAIIIDFNKFQTFEEWEDAGRPSIGDELPAKYGKPRKEPLVKAGKNDLIKDFTANELSGLRKNLHNVLWGGGGTDDNEIFSSLVNIILAKIQDELQTEETKEYEFQVFAYGKNGDELESSEKLYERINCIYQKALEEKLNLPKNEIRSAEIIDRRKFGLNKLLYSVQQLEKISFVEGRNSLDGKDILGDFFESIIREGFKQTKGQFFTPINIVQFIIYALKLDVASIEMLNEKQKLPYIIDPSAGTGTFLIEAMKTVTKTVKYDGIKKLKKNNSVQDKFNEYFMPDNRENKWAKEHLYGMDINFNLGTAAKVNMILHGDGSSNIFIGEKKGDGLLPFRFYMKSSGENLLKKTEIDEDYQGKEVNNQFDFIISNPPFSVNLDKETKRYVESEFIYGDKKNSENLFIERWYQLLKPNGRLGVVLPESVFDTSENKYIRLFLFKYFNIKAIVSLPTVTFEPYTSTKTSLLFAAKKNKKEITKWNELWREYSTEYRTLKTRVENYVEVYINGKDDSKLSSIKGHTEEEAVKDILRYLKDYVEKEDSIGNINDLLSKYGREIESLGLKKSLNDEWVNEWWVFGEVSSSLNSNIIMAEADNVGYKRTKRSEKRMPNDLFSLEELKVNLSPEGNKILNYLRANIQW